MSEVRVRGTDDPADIAVVLALLGRRAVVTPSRGLAAWAAGRRAALTRNLRSRETPIP